jgi:acetyl-CoA carboxylase biotin carboxyl carrier protein
LSQDTQPSKAAEKTAPASSGDGSTTEYWRGLAEIARKEDLDELEIEQDGVRITLRARSSEIQEAPVIYPGAYPAPMMGAATGQHTVAAPAVQGEAKAPAAKDEHLIEIVSPMVGVFYRAPSPSDPNFVEVGDHVEAGKTVALVEAMKVFNEITADMSGTVVEIFSNSSDLVETGQVLMTLRKP